MTAARASAGSDVIRASALLPRASRLALVLGLVGALGACAATAEYTAKPVRFQPPDAAAPWTITGQLESSAVDLMGDATVTVWINGQLAAVGGFQIHDGIADGSFTGAYLGRKLTVHCTNTAPPEKGFLCDIGDGLIPAGTLAFLPAGK